MNYYEILGVKKDASKEEIDQAYRQKARELHPDMNPDPKATDQFKKVNEAFEILNHPLKRAEYDLHAKVGGAGPSVGRYAYDDMMAHMFGFGRNARRKQGRDLKTEIHIDFNDVLTGCTRDLLVDRQTKCVMCMGQGAVDWQSCDVCGGSGRKVLNTTPLRFEVPCVKCRGGGKFPGKMCSDCNGTGWKAAKQETITVHVPPGVVDGMHLRLEGQGDSDGGDRGDLYVMIIINPHSFFVRHGHADVLCSIPLTYSELMFGTELEIPSIDGGKIKLHVPPRTHAGARLRLSGQGLPFLGNAERGNLYARIDLDIPEDASEEYANKVKELAEMEKSNYGRKRKTFNQLL